MSFRDLARYLLTSECDVQEELTRSARVLLLGTRVGPCPSKQHVAAVY